MINDQETHTDAFYREHANRLQDLAAKILRHADRIDNSALRKIGNDVADEVKRFVADFLPNAGNGHDR